MKARRVNRLDPGASLQAGSARIIALRLAEVRSFLPAALDPRNSEAQHDMRIAAKRLRYVLEATDFCFGKPAETAGRRARELQALLGELHDCDVMLPMVSEHGSDLRAADAAAIRARAGDTPRLDPRLAARARHRTAYRGLDVLSVYLQARRELVFDRFTAFWAQQEQVGTWDRLERAVTRKIDEARERRRAAERIEKARRELEEAERKERAAAQRAWRAAAQLEAVARDGN